MIKHAAKAIRYRPSAFALGLALALLVANLIVRPAFIPAAVGGCSRCAPGCAT